MTHRALLAALLLAFVFVPTAPAPPPAAVLKTAVVLINFTNNQAQPWTPAQVRAVAFDGPKSAAAFYLEASYGQQTLAGDVFGWWTVPYPNSPCDTLAWKNAARAMALAQGVNLDTDYGHVALVWPRTSACGFNARAGSFYNGDFSKPYAFAHEVGHSFNVNHAGRYICTENGAHSPMSGDCTVGEYGDIFDVMGASLKHFNGWEKARLGWLTNHATITTSGRYTISPLERPGQPHPQLLLIERADGTVVALEFRQRYGVFDAWNATDYAVTGVQIRNAPELPWVGSQNAATTLVDMNAGVTGFNSPLAVGQTFTDPLGGLIVTTVSVGTTGAVVDVEMS